MALFLTQVETRFYLHYKEFYQKLTNCCQSAKVGQIGTQEDCYCEELTASSLRVLL